MTPYEAFKASIATLDAPEHRAEQPELFAVLDIALQSEDGLAAILTIASYACAVDLEILTKIHRWAVTIRAIDEVAKQEKAS